jgi:hypothetical protein
VSERRARRLLAMFEASLWVAGGLAVAQMFHVAGSMPAGAPGRPAAGAAARMAGVFDDVRHDCGRNVGAALPGISGTPDNAD